MVTSVHCATYVLYVCCLCFFIHKVRRHCGPLCRLRSLNGPEGCREDREVAICLVVPASSPGLLESWNLACNPGCEASGSRSASKPISKQQLLQGDERISRRPGMTNDSHADSSFFFFSFIVMAVFPVTAGSRLFYPHLSLPGADSDRAPMWAGCGRQADSVSYQQGSGMQD